MPNDDAIAVLKADHLTVKKLFKEFGALGERATKSKERVAQQICHELDLHAQIEEQVFYPRVRAAGKDEAKEVLESLEEHKHIKEMVAELQTMSADNESFAAKMQVLQEQVTHHVKEEESEMFPEVRKALGDDVLVELGAQLIAAKAEITGETAISAKGTAAGKLTPAR